MTKMPHFCGYIHNARLHIAHDVEFHACSVLDFRGERARYERHCFFPSRVVYPCRLNSRDNLLHVALFIEPQLPRNSFIRVVLKHPPRSEEANVSLHPPPRRRFSAHETVESRVFEETRRFRTRFFQRQARKMERDSLPSRLFALIARDKRVFSRDLTRNPPRPCKVTPECVWNYFRSRAFRAARI